MRAKCALLILIFIMAASDLFAEGKRVTVVATLFPQYDFARQIGREKVDVLLLLPPGVEAHSYGPKPLDIVRIHKADIFVYTGDFMEPWAADILKGMSGKRPFIVDASKNAKLIGTKAIDPHIWLDMDNAQVMVDNIAETLINRDPGNKNFYAANAAAYKDKLKDLDNRFVLAFKECKHKIFIYAGHFVFGYFTKRYGLAYLTPYKNYSPDAEPAPGEVVELIKKIKGHGLKYIYYEEMLSPRLAATIAIETGAGLLELNGAHNATKRDLERGVTFIMLMEENLENLKKGLECRQA